MRPPDPRSDCTRPQVVAVADQVFAPAGLAQRCRVIGGDFFRSVPANGDAYR